MIKVLVVDDEMFVRRGIVMETDWAALGCVVVAEAEDGCQALEAVHKFEPELIISDIRMPKMDGIELLKTLREEGNQVKLIFLTAYSEFEYAKQALRYYAFDYILKPFEDGELETAVLRVKKDLGTKTKEAEERRMNRILPEDIVAGKSRYVREALSYIAEHYAEEDICVGKVATTLDISEGHLSHLFKKETNYTVASYVTRFRMRAAMRLLGDVRSRVNEVAEQVGYHDVTYFSSTFKKIVGVTPSEYQKKK